MRKKRLPALNGRAVLIALIVGMFAACATQGPPYWHYNPEWRNATPGDDAHRSPTPHGKSYSEEQFRYPAAPKNASNNERSWNRWWSKEGNYRTVLAPTSIGTRRPVSGPHIGRNGALTDKEMSMAMIAWKYMENNFNPETGLVNAVNDYPSTTMWDTASYLGGMVAARELGIITKETFDSRLTPFIKTLNTMDFFRGELPNKAYNTQSAAKVNYANQPGEIGYSALDLGRLLVWLYIIKERYPEHANGIDQSILRWNFCKVVDEDGLMFGAVVGPEPENATQYVQEGRLGYEEYASKGFNLWGFSTELASRPEPYNVIPIYGVDVPYDTRDPRELSAHNYVVSESYVLDGMEMNWDLPCDTESNDLHHTDPVQANFAERIYDVQVRRFEETGILTARTEHQLDGPPYFVYDTIYTDGYPWNTITEDGKYVPQYGSIALKGALGMWSLWDTPYTDLLFNAISDLYNPEKGFYEGRYENGHGVINTHTANNNGIMLEALLYKVQGKLLRFNDKASIWQTKTLDKFYGKDRCLPQHRPICRTCCSACGNGQNCTRVAPKPYNKIPQPLPEPKTCGPLCRLKRGY